jgi:Ni,Fe-hydrogenase III large subunit/Ni,Fe-hydrogenase III component G
MPLGRWWPRLIALPGSPSIGAVDVDAHGWVAIASDVAAAGGQLLALWTTLEHESEVHATVRAVLLADSRVLVPTLRMPAATHSYPGLQDFFPAATRMQRAAFDLTGVPSDDPDRRPWLRHAAWRHDEHPLRDELPSAADASVVVDDYAFVRVDGEGVHEIPVGPVHAGIIEPGHFRFSTVGEKVLKLEERLGYVHKGIERRFSELPALEGHRLAARVSGDSAVAFSWAYCQALEGLSGTVPSQRGLYLRALCLELERLQNHLGDLGALGNDAGFAFGLAQFSRLKEELLRAMHAAIGQRYLLDAVVPGGTAFDLRKSAAVTLGEAVDRIGESVLELQRIYDEHAGVRDRFVGAGEVTPELARRLGLAGLAGRASGLGVDLRADRPSAPYDVLHPVKCVRRSGDVAARVAVRFDEVQESCRLVAAILSNLPPGDARIAMPPPARRALAIGLVEGWRGPVLVALESSADGGIHRCHPHDPSWQNWPVLEHAIIGNIVPDFPLINKSFNLSYSGHDL